MSLHVRPLIYTVPGEIGVEPRDVPCNDLRTIIQNMTAKQLNHQKRIVMKVGMKDVDILDKEMGR
jgi:hypothetical protein